MTRSTDNLALLQALSDLLPQIEGPIGREQKFFRPVRSTHLDLSLGPGNQPSQPRRSASEAKPGARFEVPTETKVWFWSWAWATMCAP
jgi:hypothetical protein